MSRTARRGVIAAVAAVLVAGCMDRLTRRRGPGPRDVAVEHYQKAMKAIDAEDIDMAIVEIKNAIAADPTLALYHYIYGNLLAQKGEFVQAELEYQQVVSRDPHYDPAWEGLIQVVAAQREPERVPLVIRKRVQVDPLDVNWRLRLGLAYEKTGQLLEAERELRAAADLGRGEAAAYAHARLGLVYEALGRPTAAIREYQEALKLNPNLTEVRRILDRLYAPKAAP